MMFKRSLLAAAFVGALAVGSFGAARSAEAGGYHHRHHHHHCEPAAVYGVRYAPHPYARNAAYRSAYYGYPVRPGYGYPARPGYGHRAHYSAPAPYGVYSRGPAFRLSIGF